MGRGQRHDFDLAFGIGGACCCTQALRAAHLQYASFPWDWVAESDIRTRINQVRDGFVDWLPREALTRIECAAYQAGAIYRNELTRVVFPHDFPLRGSLEADYATVAARYRRRAERLCDLISKARRVLVVWVDMPACPKATAADCQYVLGVLRGRWPAVHFEMVAFAQDNGRHVSNAVVDCDGVVHRVAYAYQDPGHDSEATGRNLARWLKAFARVADYRTPEERRAWRRQLRRHELGRYRATGPVSYIVNKIQYKLYVHFKKKLTRKGVI